MASIVKIFVIVPMGQNVAMLMGIVNVPQGGWETVDSDKNSNNIYYVLNCHSN
jgi:hypothetical protein